MTRYFPPAILRRRRGALAVAVLAEARHLAADAQFAARQGADLLEIRGDLFPKKYLRSVPLAALLKKIPKPHFPPRLLTLRTRAEGGQMPRGYSEADRLSLFRAAFPFVDGVDVELTAEEIVPHVVMEAHKRGKFVIVSRHSFHRGLGNRALSLITQRARLTGADVIKLAVKASTPEDVERLMQFCRSWSFPHRVMIPMGPHGRSARIHPSPWGSRLTYGYLRRPLAPGQTSLAELLKRK